MKTLFCICLGILLSSGLAAQNYTIKNETQRINNKKHAGVSSVVEASLEEVEPYWIDYIKDHGKARRKRNYYQVTEFNVNDLGVDSLTYGTRVEASGEYGLIWIAPLDNDLSEEEIAGLNSDLEKILKMATRGYYVSEVQKKIDQAEAAAVSVSKSHQRLIYNGEKLVTDLEGANELKADLQARLEETELKIRVLNQQIIDNKVAVDSVYNDLEQVKQVIEAHKESMKKIK
jgi:uncharacterized protein YfkK (UPF0435 family)